MCVDSSEIHHDPKFHDLVDAQLTRAKQILIELTILTKSLSTGACVKRLLWAKEKQAAKKLQADLKDIRETLHMLLGVKTSLVLSIPVLIDLDLEYR